MDKFNKRRRRAIKDTYYLCSTLFGISYNHDKLFKLYERSLKKTKNIDIYIDNIDESDKVIYEENIIKPVQKFKG